MASSALSNEQAASANGIPTQRTPSSSLDNRLQQRPQKRVAIACDYCRKKRLKCTAGPRPCMNCQLYSAECTVTPTHKKRGPAPSQSKRAKRNAAAPSVSLNNDSSIQSPGNSSDSRTTSSAPGLSNSTVSIPDAVTDAQVRAHDLQQENSINNIDNHGEGSISMRSCDLLTGHPAFTDLENPGLSHQDSALLGEFFNNSGFQDSMSDMYFADLYASQDHDASNRMSLQSSLADLAGTSQRSMQGGGGALKVFGLEDLKSFLDSKATENAIVPGLLIKTNQHDSGFIGFISTGATLAGCLQEPIDDSPVNTESKTGEWLANAGTYVHGAGSPSTIDIVHELPPQTLAQAGIEAYFEHVHVFHPILDQQTCREYWDRLYTQQISSPTSLDILILNLVVAIGLLCGAKADSASMPALTMSQQLHQKAWMSLNETLFSTGLQSVQALLLHAIYHMYVGRTSRAWSLCGIAVRSAQALGIHRSNPVNSGYTLEQMSLRSQIWWVAFSLDATLSIAEGRPPAVAESTCDVQLIVPDWQSDNTFASNMFTWKVGLAHIQNRLCSVLSRCNSPHSRRAALGEVEQELTKWREDMPVECRPGQEMIPGSTDYLLLASLHLEYFSVARALYWSCMTCVPSQDDQAHMDQTAHRSRGHGRAFLLCLGSARAFVRTLNSAVEDDKERRIFPMSLPVDQYAAALAILYRNICRNPEGVATRVDLEYFRACKLHLERDAYPQFMSSTIGDLVDDMLSSVEKLLARS